MTRRWFFLLAAAAAVAGCSDGRNPSILNPQGSEAGEASFLFWLMLALGAPVVALVAGLLLASALRRRAAGLPPPPGDAERGEKRSVAWIVAGGVILPVVVVVPLSVLTLFSLNRTERPPADDALVVEVVGHRFWWEVRYPENGIVTANEIHLPVDRDVRFVLTSADVVHSFWVPNLGGKRDMIPGEVTDLAYQVDEPGIYEGFCAEFCGIQHAWMRLLVIAHPPEEFEAWLEQQSSDAAPPRTDLERFGLETFLQVGCASCHRVGGTDADGGIGPDLTHFADRLTVGAGVAANRRGNLGGWISNPHGLKPGATMPPTPLTGDQLIALIAYLESLR